MQESSLIENTKDQSKNIKKNATIEDLIFNVQDQEECRSTLNLSPIRSTPIDKKSKSNSRKFSFKPTQKETNSTNSKSQSPNYRTKSRFQIVMRQKLKYFYQMDDITHQVFQIQRSNSVEKEILTSSSEIKDLGKKKKQYNSDRLINGAINDDENQLSGCKCKQSKCLKLYCQCFQNGNMCSTNCKCLTCCNNENFTTLRDQAVEELKSINPLAFKSKYKKLDKRNVQLHTRGCNCKNSKCIKNYCECYMGQVGCSVLCKCKDCHNKKSQISQAEKANIQENTKRKKRRSNADETFKSETLSQDISISKQFLKHLSYCKFNRPTYFLSLIQIL